MCSKGWNGGTDIPLRYVFESHDQTVIKIGVKNEDVNTRITFENYDSEIKERNAKEENEISVARVRSMLPEETFTIKSQTPTGLYERVDQVEVLTHRISRLTDILKEAEYRPSVEKISEQLRIVQHTNEKDSKILRETLTSKISTEITNVNDLKRTIPARTEEIHSTYLYPEITGQSRSSKLNDPEVPEQNADEGQPQKRDIKQDQSTSLQTQYNIENGREYLKELEEVAIDIVEMEESKKISYVRALSKPKPLSREKEMAIIQVMEIPEIHEDTTNSGRPDEANIQISEHVSDNSFNHKHVQNQWNEKTLVSKMITLYETKLENEGKSASEKDESEISASSITTESNMKPYHTDTDSHRDISIEMRKLEHAASPHYEKKVKVGITAVETEIELPVEIHDKHETGDIHVLNSDNTEELTPHRQIVFGKNVTIGPELSFNEACISKQIDHSEHLLAEGKLIVSETIERDHDAQPYVGMQAFEDTAVSEADTSFEVKERDVTAAVADHEKQIIDGVSVDQTELEQPVEIHEELRK
ncbi:unnamed protein product, partial [Thelazia callipaeda]|uniref:Titin n=1 Tax=Thelazia callipaeda TaxID=103827 RepID=A0A0N5CKZ2_THECL